MRHQASGLRGDPPAQAVHPACPACPAALGERDASRQACIRADLGLPSDQAMRTHPSPCTDASALLHHGQRTDGRTEADGTGQGGRVLAERGEGTAVAAAFTPWLS